MQFRLPMKKVHAILFSFLMMTMSLAGCFGSGDEDSETDTVPNEPELSDWEVYHVESGDDLPNCNSETLGRLYYVASTTTFEVCLTSGWSFIDIKGADGEMGPAGADGVDGTDGLDGEDGQDVDQAYIDELELRVAELETKILELEGSLSAVINVLSNGNGVIDNSRATQIISGQEKNIARDSNGIIHVVYIGVYEGMWTPMYTSGDGYSWNTSIPIRTESYNGVSDYYTPSILIDNQDNLHVVFNDYGQISGSDEKTNAGFDYPGYGYTGYYVKCESSCNVQSNWVNPFTGEVGGGLLPATSQRYQSHFDMDAKPNADGTDDDVFITWREDGVNRETVAYRIDATDGFVALPSLGDGYLSQNIVVDNDNQVLFVGGEYYNENAMKVYELSDDHSSWLLRDKLIPRIREGMSMDSNTPVLGDNDGLLRHYRISTVVDSDNHLHIVTEVKDEWHNDKWRMIYYEFNPSTVNPQTYNSVYSATGNTEGKLTAVWVNADTNPEHHQLHPQIVVDESTENAAPTIHVFSWVNSDVTYSSLYTMTPVGDEFSGGEDVLGVVQNTGGIKAIQGTSVRIDGAVVIDVIVCVGLSELRYYQIELTAR